MSNMGKGAGYYLTRSKSLLIDTAIVAILAIFMSFAMQMDALQSKGEDYLVLMLYAVIFGLTSLQSGAMIVDLTAKDKLSRRVEFFAASGIAVKEIIKQYSIRAMYSARAASRSSLRLAIWFSSNKKCPVWQIIQAEHSVSPPVLRHFFGSLTTCKQQCMKKAPRFAAVGPLSIIPLY